MTTKAEECRYSYMLGLLEGWLEHAAQCGPGSIRIEKVNKNCWIVTRPGKDDDGTNIGKSDNSSDF
jgi:hypothetical protein